MIEHLQMLMLQLSVITAAAWLGGRLFSSVGFPSVLGEMCAGVIIGPFALGGFAFMGLDHGLFPVEGVFPASIELYSLATLASIVLLFYVGLETDLDTFMRFSVAGTTIGLFGGVLSFVLGNFAGMFYLHQTTGELVSFGHPICLFFGVISTATSVSITARLLLDKRRMSAPDGVTILSAAVIDDIIGIVALAIVVGMSGNAVFNGDQIALIAGKAIGTWLLVMIVGLLLAKRLSRFLHKLDSPQAIAIMSLSFAMLLAGLLEMAGLAMVIGAYTAGLIFSRTDLDYLIQEQLEPLRRFLVPIFFCVMGMFIDLRVLLIPEVLFISIVYTVLAVIGKFVGCYVPATFLNFTPLGASRIAVGMIPRGEIALIIAAVGISSGIITQEIFSIAVVMTFFTTLLTPPVLNRLLNIDKTVLKKPLALHHEVITIRFDMPNPETAELIHDKILHAFRKEGFFAHRPYHGLYALRKDSHFITMRYSRTFTEFDCNAEDETLVYVLFHEVMSELERFIHHLKHFGHEDRIARKIIASKNRYPEQASLGVFGKLSPFAIEHDLMGTTREDILDSLIRVLMRAGQINSRQAALTLRELLEAEKISTMALPEGVAMPHVVTEGVDHLIYAFGVSRAGVDLGDPGGEKTHLFFLALIPAGQQEEHLEDFAALGQFLSDPKNRSELLTAETHLDLVRVVKEHSEIKHTLLPSFAS